MSLADHYPNRLKMAWIHRYRVGTRGVLSQAYDLPGHCKIEPEMIFQIDPDLAIRIIRERGPHI